MGIQRLLLKLSGESLAGPGQAGVDGSRVAYYAREVQAVCQQGVEVAIVLGGGNIFRGAAGISQGFPRTKGDQMGMLATAINSLALGEVLYGFGQPTAVMTSFAMGPVGQVYSVDSARAFLDAGRVVIIAGGTGNPYFTTDTAAALRACELGCDLLVKGTRVDGVYDLDPEKHPEAKRYDRISFREAYERELRIMDLTAFTLCQENGVPIRVVDINAPGTLRRLAEGEELGTLIHA